MSGLGSSLLRRAAQELAAQGIAEWRLTVVAGNERAKALYERQGMTVVSHILLGSLPAVAPSD